MGPLTESAQAILYLDTSALVKLYAREAGREEVRRAVREASAVAISEIGYVEARSAFARREREGVFSAERHDRAVELLARDFRDIYLMRPVAGQVVVRAGDLVRKHALRAYDAVHLATALGLREEARELAGRRRGPAEGEDQDEVEDYEPQVLLMAYDSALVKAARIEGLGYGQEATPSNGGGEAP